MTKTTMTFFKSLFLIAPLMNSQWYLKVTRLPFTKERYPMTSLSAGITRGFTTYACSFLHELCQTSELYEQILESGNMNTTIASIRLSEVREASLVMYVGTIYSCCEKKPKLTSQ